MVQTRRTTLLQLTAAPTPAHADATATVSANGVNATETTSTGAALTVWNSLSWERKEWLKVEPVTSAATSEWVQVAVPALGAAFVDLTVTVQGQAAALAAAVDCIRVGPTSLENELLRVEFDPQDGSIASVYDKQCGREVLAPLSGGGARAGGNRLAVYLDDGSDIFSDRPSLAHVDNLQPCAMFYALL